MTINTNLRAAQRITRECIDKVLADDGTLAADLYVGGLLLGISEYMTDRYGRRAAYNFLAGFADDLIFPESSDKQLGRERR